MSCGDSDRPRCGQTSESNCKRPQRKGRDQWPKLDYINTGPTSEIQEFAAILKQMIKKVERRRANKKRLRTKTANYRTDGFCRRVGQ